MSELVKSRWFFKRDYDLPVRELYLEPMGYVPKRGITNTWAPEIPKLERRKSLDHYEDSFHLCVKCGECRYVHAEPTWNRVCPSGELKKFESYYAGGKNLLLWGIRKGELELTKETAEIFYHCTLCGNCQQQCQVPEMHFWLVDWFEDSMERAVELGVGPMPQQDRYGQHIEKEHNPYMELHAHRLRWLPFPPERLSKKAEVLYLVGCTSSYRQKEIAMATVSVFKKMKIDFAIMEDEWCCGSPLIRTGQTKRALSCAEHNLKEIEKTGAKVVVTSCAGCYRTLTEDYKDKFGLGYEFEVIH